MVSSFFLLALIAAPVEPASPRISVRWSAPVGCPDQSSVVEAVRELSGAEVVEEGEDLTATVEVTTRDAGYELSLSVVTETATRVRVLEAADCQVLVRAAALVVAVALDPVLVVSRWPAPAPAPVPEPEPASVPAPAPEPAPVVPEPAPAPAPAPPQRRGELGALEYGVGLNVGVVGLTLPGVGPSFGVAPFVGFERMHLRLGAQYRAPRRETLPRNTDAGARFQLAAGGVRLCPNAMPGRDRRVRIPLCAGVDVGAVFADAEGSAVRNGTSARSFWAAATFEAGVSVQVARFVSLTGGFEAGVALSRPRFSLDGGGQVHRVGRFAPRGIVGAQFHRPR